MGLIYNKMGNYRQAIPYFNKAIDKNPKYGMAFFHRGEAKYKMGDQSGGCEDIHKSTELGYTDQTNEISCE